MKSLKKNYLYSIFYQILSIFIPFFTVPYVSRVLGADNVGTYSFTNSIVTYFMVLSMLGISNYGNREIARCRENKKTASKTFFNIYAIQFISSSIMALLYALYVIFFAGEYQGLALIQAISFASVFFDFSWFFFGREEFKITVARNSIIKVLTLIATFLFVKTPDDLATYTLILSLGVLLNQLSLLPPLLKRVVFVKPSLAEMKKHLKPCLILFIPVISISLYNIMDKTMLGIMTNMGEVGYYAQAEKITQIPLALITALSVVMMPRISNLVAKSDGKKIREYISRAISFMAFMAIPVSLGLAIVAPTFIPIFLGSGYEKSSLLLALLAIAIPFKALGGGVLRSQYMTPHGMDKEYVRVTAMGAVVNLGLNALFIPFVQSVGACIGTIVAEFAVLAYMIFILRKKLPMKQYLRAVLSNAWKGAVMFTLVFPINFIPGLNNYAKLVIEIALGVIIYMILNYKMLSRILRRRNEKTSQ